MKTFDQILKYVPNEIRDILEQLKDVKQNPKYHPEIYVYNHIEQVYHNASLSGDINLMIAALFHDLGKLSTAKPHKSLIGISTFFGHEIHSTILVNKYGHWITKMGADFDKVQYIVANHMKMKVFDDMRKGKQDAMRQHPYFDLLVKFSDCDSMI